MNAVAPIFIIALLGGLLARYKILDKGFFENSEKLIFRVALPALLFLEIISSNLKEIFDARLILFSCIGIIVSWVLLCIIAPFIVRDRGKRGAFIQGSFRCNFAILGIPIAKNMFGDSGVALIAALMPFTVMLFNILGVVILSIYAPDEKKEKPIIIIKNVVLKIIKNPFVIAIAFAFVLKLADFTLPSLAEKTLTQISNLTLPLSLMSIGAGFSIKSLKGRFGVAMAATVAKTVVLPLIALVVAVLMGFKGVQLGVVFILFGGPAAVSSYIMAKNMGSDHELAGQIVLLSTLFCLFTIFFGAFVLKYMNLI